MPESIYFEIQLRHFFTQNEAILKHVGHYLDGSVILEKISHLLKKVLECLYFCYFFQSYLTESIEIFPFGQARIFDVIVMKLD